MPGTGVELAVAYISLVPSTAGIAPAISKEVAKAEGQVASSGKKAGAGYAAGLGGAIGGAAKKVFAPLAAAAAGIGIGKFFADAVKGASDLEQSVGAVDAVFKNQAASIKASASAAAMNLGLTRSEYNDLAATLGSLLKNKGIKDFTGQTQSLINVGADLAAQFGGTTKEAVDALGSALRGETDPIERYGVSMNDAAIKAEAMRMGLVETSVDAGKVAAAQIRAELAQRKYNEAVRAYGVDSDQAKKAQASLISAQGALAKATAGTKVELTDQQKAQAALSLISRQTADAQGAAAREQDTYAGRLARLTASWGDFKATVGGPVIAVLATLMGWMTSTVQAVDGLFRAVGGGNDELGLLQRGFQALASSPVGQWFADLGRSIMGVVGPAFKQVAASITGQLWPALQTLGGILVAAGKAFAGFVAVIMGSPLAQFLLTVLKGALMGFVQGVADIFQGLVRVVSGVFDALAGLLTGDWSRMWSGLGQVVVGAVQAVWGFLQAGLMGRVLGMFRGFIAATGLVFGGFGAFMSGLFRGLLSGFIEFGGTLGKLAGSVITPAIKGVGAVFGLLKGLADTAIGGVVSAFTALGAKITGALKMSDDAMRAFGSAVQGVWTTVVGAITGAWQTIFGGVLTPMRATLVGTLLAAWNGFRDTISRTWQAVTAATSAAWSSITVVFTTLRTWLTATLVGAWNGFRTLVAAVWAAVSSAISTGWSRVLAIFTLLRTWVATTLTAMWNTFRTLVATVWTGISTAIANAWNAILTRVFTPLRTWVATTLTAMWNAFRTLVASVWSGITTTVSNAWNAIRDRVFTPLRTWVTSTLTSALRTLQSVAATVWSAVTSTISSAWTRVSGTFTALRNGLKGVWDYFGTAVSGIGKTWDGIRDKVTAPVRYVVNNIIRDKLVAAWNAVASKLSLPAFSFAGFARGGWTGPGSRLQPAGVVHADEFVIKKSSRRRIERERPGLLDAMNRTGRVPGYAGGGRVLGLGLPGYATGGAVTNWDARTASGLRMWAAWMRTLIAGKFGVRDIGGYRPVDPFPDHPSGRALDIMTYSDRSRGDAIASWLMANHKAANLNYLIWKQRSWNPRRGSWNLMPNRGSITANHFDHVHALFNPGGGNPSGLGGKLTPEMIAALQAGGGGAGISMPNPAAEAAKALVNPLFSGARSLIDGIAGKFGTSAWVDIVKAGAKMPVDQVQKWLTSKIDSVFPALTVGGSGAANEGGTQVSAAGSGVQRWSAVATQALRMTGQPTSLLPTLLRRMQQESGGNPNAINNWDINAKRGDPSKGLMQVIGSTFRRYAMPGHNTNIYDPMSNILASIRYAVARYGSLAAAYNRAGGYADGGLVAPVKLFDGGGMLERGDIAVHAAAKPDRVLTDAQWRAVMRHLPISETGDVRGRGGAGVTINGDVFGDPERFARQITTRMRDELVLADLAGV